MLLNPTFSRLTDAAGNPVNGGTATFYLTGTTTLTSVYTDSTLTTPLANPLSSDSDGLLPSVFGNPALAYKIVYKGSDGAVLRTVDRWSVEGVSTPVDAVAGANLAVTSAYFNHIAKRTHSSAMADTLPAAAGAGNGARVTIWNASAYADTVTVSGGGTIDGAASRVVQAGQRVTFVSTGTEWTAEASPLTTGPRFIPVSAAFLTPAVTNGCGAVAQAETATHKVNYLYREFSNAANKIGCQTISLPPSYDGGAIEWQAVYTTNGGAAGETLRHVVAARMFSDDDALDGPFGSASSVDDTILAVGDVHVTAWASLTPANAGAGRLMAFIYIRDNGFGTHAQPIRLIELRFRPALNKSSDA